MNRRGESYLSQVDESVLVGDGLWGVMPDPERELIVVSACCGDDDGATKEATEDEAAPHGVD